MSKRRLTLDEAPVPVLIEGDSRVQALEFARIAPQDTDQFVNEIERLWKSAHDSFLSIGRLLINAKEMLPYGEYEAMVQSKLPFSTRTAYQLREAAQWALGMEQSREVQISQLPGSYSTIYLLSTLDAGTLSAAKEEGLLRPDLRRAELIAWRKSRQVPAAQPSLKALLLQEKAKLEGRLLEIEQELTRLHNTA